MTHWRLLAPISFKYQCLLYDEVNQRRNRILLYILNYKLDRHVEHWHCSLNSNQQTKIKLPAKGTGKYKNKKEDIENTM